MCVAPLFYVFSNVVIIPHLSKSYSGKAAVVSAGLAAAGQGGGAAAQGRGMGRTARAEPHFLPEGKKGSWGLDAGWREATQFNEQVPPLRNTTL